MLRIGEYNPRVVQRDACRREQIGENLHMSTAAKSDTNSTSDEERLLIHGLVTRGLATREEIQEARADTGEALGPEGFLSLLVKKGCLTMNQARRAVKDLPLLLNQQIPGYQLLNKLGQGSMGTVYKARQISMDRLVAVKILNPKLAANKEYLESFMREAHLAAKLSHANIIQAIDVGSAGGSIHYFVMEYVEGITIKDELEKGKIYEEKEALEIGIQIAEALDHAAKRGLIHRDVKPANIVLTHDRVAKLADLGMARATEDSDLAKAEKGMTIGTPYYIAPEQIGGRLEIDSRADIYSLGATLYHMVTGQPPFPYFTVPEVLAAHRKEELLPPRDINDKISLGFGEVIECMMAKKRVKRYESGSDAAFDLECILRDEPPKLAREQFEPTHLEELAEAEAEDMDEDEIEEPEPEPETVSILWVYALGAALTLSMLANLFLAVL